MNDRYSKLAFLHRLKERKTPSLSAQASFAPFSLKVAWSGKSLIPGVAPFSFRIVITDLFVHRGQKSYTPTAFGKLWTTPGVRCMKHASS